MKTRQCTYVLCQTVFLVALHSPVVAQKMYWTDPAAGVIQRANLDGSNVETVISRFSPTGIAVDSNQRKVYWTDTGTIPRIQRANFDGTQVEDVVTDLVDPYGLAIDVMRSKLYWTDAAAGKIQRANLDGTGIEDIVIVGYGSPRGLAIDTDTQHIYWTDFIRSEINRANTDGSGKTCINSFALEPDAIALDLVSGKMYWAASPYCFYGSCGWPTLQRSNLDGTNREHLFLNAGTAAWLSPSAIIIDSINNKVTHQPCAGDSSGRGGIFSLVT